MPSSTLLRHLTHGQLLQGTPHWKKPQESPIPWTLLGGCLGDQRLLWKISCLVGISIWLDMVSTPGAARECVFEPSDDTAESECSCSGESWMQGMQSV